jgi:predicted DCC family thiol-disulfide oxidoreductase YuxK
VIERHPEVAGADSVVWVEPARSNVPETVAVRSDAVIRVARYLGGPWHLVRLVGWLPRAVRDRAYVVVARHRHRLPGLPACIIPPAREQSRFLP